MNGHGKSDRFVVPANPPNKAAAAEAGEEREPAEDAESVVRANLQASHA